MGWGIVCAVLFFVLWIATLAAEECRICRMRAENQRRQDEIKRLAIQNKRDHNLHAIAKDLHREIRAAAGPMLETVEESIRHHEQALESGTGHSEGEVAAIAPRLYSQAAVLKPLLSEEQERHLDGLLNEYCGDPNRYRALPKRALDHANALRTFLQPMSL